LSQESWIENYYKPMEKGFKVFLKRHKSWELVREVADNYKAEIDLFMTIKEYYSNVFYIARKNK